MLSHEVPWQFMDKGNPKRSGWAGITAIGSVILASSCCLPLLPFAAAAGAAGVSNFMLQARPYLLGVSVLSIAYGFYQARQARQCSGRPKALTSVLLWAALLLVGVSILFPQVLANAAADWLG